MSVNTIETMVNWIEDNITENPTLDEMSNFVGYSPYYCSAKFHKHVGVTFKKYLAKRRLSLAAIDVRDTNHRIIDIALDYGFLSPEAFSRAFMHDFGCTPYEYRKKLTHIKLYDRAEGFHF